MSKPSKGQEMTMPGRAADQACEFRRSERRATASNSSEGEFQQRLGGETEKKELMMRKANETERKK